MLRFTILGCGSSGGVPRIGGIWGACDPDEPRNWRRRCSMLVERVGTGGVTRVLIDTSPDLRDQMLTAGVSGLEGVVYTHSHADHVHGLDDLRGFVLTSGQRLSVWADEPTSEALISRFAYAFVQPKDSPYPPILELNTIRDSAIEIAGPGGVISLLPIRVDHGSMEALGFRIEGLAYLPDVVRIPDAAWPALAGLDCLVIDALRRKPHPTHAHLALTLEWIERAAPLSAVLTNMHIDLDYQTLCEELPSHIRPAHDGLVLTL